ncbi:RNA chaperone Hfq [Sphingomonas sabuli]|uniref:RNA-binding protein Hfq n=1 Tax=Sphingomonas sabuli TaxID=2764186 RepID=A0A7G9L3J5_9SPHN|nr:RNA chaperone Hfq [Sphingomonas sabuli]QNM83194.1 RNA chaperone Hfq [Sphingomonas sabuli]
MTAKTTSLQDHFLNSARRSKTPLTAFLLKGVKLQGVITWFDPFSLLLRREGRTQLVYKHSISTIMPGGAMDLGDLSAWEGQGQKGLQDAFLSAAERDGEAVTMFLVNGVMLQGQVARHDQFSLLLERDAQVQLVYKHAISTIEPEHPLQLSDPAGGEAK